MTAIVTGATGFLGTVLADHLESCGERVRRLSRRPRPGARSDSAGHIVVDFSRGPSGFPDDALDGVEAVYHLAGATRASSRHEFDAANVRATRALLDWIQRSGRTPRFVYVSSQAAAGPAPSAARPLGEADTPAPVDDYGRSKLAAEQLVLSRGDALPVVVVRPTAVYGPHDRDFLNLFRMSSRGLSVFPGNRSFLLDMVFAPDLVRGFRLAATTPGTAGRTYFLGGTSQSWATVYETVASVVGRPSQMNVQVPMAIVQAAAIAGDAFGRLTGRVPLLNSGKAKLGAQQFWLASSERARTELGYSATTSLRGGLEATYDWYLRNRWL